jgi:hypothetical protein
VEAAVFAGANDQAGAKGAACDYEFVCHGVLQWILNLLRLGYKFRRALVGGAGVAETGYSSTVTLQRDSKSEIALAQAVWERIG